MSDDIFDIERGGKKKDARGQDVGTVVIVSLAERRVYLT